MNEPASINMVGDILSILFIFVFLIIIPAIIIFIIYKLIKRIEKRANKRLSFERENTVLLKKQLGDLNDRVVVLEKTLRKVE